MKPTFSKVEEQNPSAKFTQEAYTNFTPIYKNGRKWVRLITNDRYIGRTVFIRTCKDYFEVNNYEKYICNDIIYHIKKMEEQLNLKLINILVYKLSKLESNFYGDKKPCNSVDVFKMPKRKKFRRGPRKFIHRWGVVIYYSLGGEPITLHYIPTSLHDFQNMLLIGYGNSKTIPQKYYDGYRIKKKHLLTWENWKEWLTENSFKSFDEETSIHISKIILNKI